MAKRGEEREEMARTRTVTHNIGVVLPSDVYYGSGVYFQNCLLGVCEIGIDARVQCADYDEQRA